MVADECLEVLRRFGAVVCGFQPELALHIRGRRASANAPRQGALDAACRSRAERARGGSGGGDREGYAQNGILGKKWCTT